MTELVDCDAYTREELIQLRLPICNVCHRPTGRHRRQGKTDNGEASNFLRILDVSHCHSFIMLFILFY